MWAQSHTARLCKLRHVLTDTLGHENNRKEHCTATEWRVGLRSDKLQVLCVLFSEVFCVRFPLLYFHYSKEVFKSAWQLSRVCGEQAFKSQRENFTPFINKRYDLYFGCKVGNQDKS